MADRHHHNPLPPSSRLITTTSAHIPSKPSARLIQQPPGPSTSTGTQPPTASSVRRNLFHSQRTHRPPHPSSTSNETIRLHHNYPPSDDPYQDNPPSPSLPPPSPSADIVPRNSLGEIELLGDPPTPPLYNTDDDNDHPPSSPPHHHSHSHPHDHQKAGQLAARARLTEAVRQHQRQQNKLLMSIPGNSSSNFANGGIGIGMQPPLNTQPEGKNTSSSSPLLLFDKSSFLFSPHSHPHCSDPLCSGPDSSPSSFPNNTLAYYPASSSSSPDHDGRSDKKGKGKMIAVDDDDDDDDDDDAGYYSGEDDNYTAEKNDGTSFAKTKKFTETELVDEVKASLRAKVAALAQDNWMFEPEELPRPH